MRILVNNEISELILGLSKSSNLISQDGVIAVITFHSLEDRICKFFLNEISSLKKFQDIYQLIVLIKFLLNQLIENQLHLH